MEKEKGRKKKREGKGGIEGMRETPPSSSYEPKVSPGSEEGARRSVTHYAQSHNTPMAPSCTQRVLATMKTVEFRGDRLQEPAHGDTGSAELLLYSMI